MAGSKLAEPVMMRPQSQRMSEPFFSRSPWVGFSRDA